ncbi:MAG: MFS transporter [Anaerolineae bacterium]|nr:MFS transporter [Anaerolineae bacterium]
MSAGNVLGTDALRKQASNPMLNALGRRDFRLLWIGQGASSLGDQFTAVALPWLVLQLTGDPLALGATLALQGLPRALFLLVGGAITDRFSSRAVMLICDAVRLAVTALLAVLVFAGQTQMWVLYAVAVIAGIVSGFFTPAANSIVPTLVAPEELQAANSVSMGTVQLTSLVGPVLAGGLIALLGPEGQSAPQRAMAGMTLAFATDAASFAASLVTLWLIRARPVRPAHSADLARMLASVGEGIGYAWRDATLRTALVIIAIAPFLSTGPSLVGLPVLAKVRLTEGAAALGLIMGSNAAGNLLGYVAAGMVKVRRLGTLVPGLVAVLGAGLALLGLVQATPAACAITLVLGAANGFFAIIFFTWLQKRTPAEMLGRMMSLLFFFNVGLTPLSQALAGALVRLNLTGLFLASGALLVLLGLWTLSNREVRAMEA